MQYTTLSHLSVDNWTTRAKAHATAVAPFTEAFLKRRSLGIPHPVHDFLFTYYNCSPQKLKQWIPAIDEILLVTPQTKEDFPWFNEYWFQTEENLLFLNKERIQTHTRGLATFVATLCANILQRPPRYGCYGLHEWAMVYKSSEQELRHNGYRLRVSPQKLAEFVESQSICCSHYDAYRFFTKEAQPLNVLNPTIDTRLEMEQGGCVHANMDIYKWAIKLWPWIGSNFLEKAFFLALEGRELDMRASPYDLAEAGFEPICIETESGRKQYQKEQQLLFERATPLREELRLFCTRLATM